MSFKLLYAAMTDSMIECLLSLMYSHMTIQAYAIYFETLELSNS